MNHDEEKIIQKSVAMLRMARRVIEKMNAGEGEGFREEPSLSDLVLVAQIIGQTATIDRLGEMGTPPEGAVLPASEGRLVQSLEGPQPIALALPDLIVMWSPDGWYVHSHPELQQDPRCCRSAEELASALQQAALVCGQHRTPPVEPQ